MIRRALLLLAIAGIYILVSRKKAAAESTDVDHAAEAQWANEGGGNAPTTV